MKKNSVGVIGVNMIQARRKQEVRYFRIMRKIKLNILLGYTEERICKGLNNVDLKDKHNASISSCSINVI